MRKRKNIDNIDAISQWLLILQKKRKIAPKKVADCSSRNRTKKKQKKNKSKGRN